MSQLSHKWAIRQPGAKCCVRHCQNRKGVDTKLNFHKFPRNKKVIEMWCTNLNIDVPDLHTLKKLRVCSIHFHKTSKKLSLPLFFLSPPEHPGEKNQDSLVELSRYTHPQDTAVGIGDSAIKKKSTLESYSENQSIPNPNIVEEHAYCSSDVKLEDQSCERVSPVDDHLLTQATTKQSSKAKATVYRSAAWSISHAGAKCCVKHCKNRVGVGEKMSFHKFPRDREVMKMWCTNMDIDVPDQNTLRKLRVCDIHFNKTGTKLGLPIFFLTPPEHPNEKNQDSIVEFPTSSNTHQDTTAGISDSLIKNELPLESDSTWRENQSENTPNVVEEHDYCSADDFESEIRFYENRVWELEQEVQSCEIRVLELEQKFSDVQQDAQSESRVRELEQNLIDVEQEVHSWENKIWELEQELTDVEQDNQSCDNQVWDLEQKLPDVKQEVTPSCDNQVWDLEQKLPDVKHEVIPSCDEGVWDPEQKLPDIKQEVESGENEVWLPENKFPDVKQEVQSCEYILGV